MYHVGGANIESETGLLVKLKQAKEERLVSGKYLFTDEFVLYSKIRPYLNKVALPDFTGICSADIYPIKPKGALITKYFLRQLLMSRDFLAFTANNSDRANIPKINRKALVAYKTRKPPINIQKKFTAIAKKIECIRDFHKMNLQDLENLYGAISQKAFKGQLDLSRIPLPEGASKAHEDTPTDQIPVIDEVNRIVEYSMSVPAERTKLLRRLLDEFLAQHKGDNLSLDDFWQQVSIKTMDRMDESGQSWGVEDYDQVKDWLFELLREGRLEQNFTMNTASSTDGQIALKIKD